MKDVTYVSQKVDFTVRSPANISVAACQERHAWTVAMRYGATFQLMNIIFSRQLYSFFETTILEVSGGSDMGAIGEIPYQSARWSKAGEQCKCLGV